MHHRPQHYVAEGTMALTHATPSWIPQELQALEEQPPHAPRVPTCPPSRAGRHAALTPRTPILRHAPRLPKDHLINLEEEIVHRENPDFENYVPMVVIDQVSREPRESLLKSRQAKHLAAHSLSRPTAVGPMRTTTWMWTKPK